MSKPGPQSSGAKPKRVVTKIGDIFSVKVTHRTKKYFQLIAFDLLQLNSDVIRAFKNEVPIDSAFDPFGIVAGEVDFYAHCVTKWGVKLGYWEKEGRANEVGDLTNILFRDATDYGCVAGETPPKFSQRWTVWRLGDDDFTYVGKLRGQNREAEIGIVMDPESIVERMQTGEYGGYYPDFE